MQVRMQVIIIFLLTTIVCGQAGQSLSLFTSGLEKTSWNPFLILYYAWIKMFLVTLILNVIINSVILYVRINMDTTMYDKDRNFEISKKGTMGTGGFMQTADKTKSLIMDEIENINGAILGKDPDTNLVCSPKPSLYINNHKVICGGSGSRKTTTQVLNELFQAIKRGESFIVTDPKGEIYEMISVLAEQEGYITKVMNLVNLENSDGIDFVKACFDKNGNQDKEIRAVQTLAKVIMANTAENITGGFWDDNQRGLLTAAILYVMYDKTGRTEPTLAGAYEFLLHNDKTEIDRLFTSLDKSHPARAEYLIYAKTEAKVRDSVLNGLMMRLQVLQTESAKRIVSSDEIDLTLPSQRKCAYFLIMSDQESTFDFISSLFFSMFFIKDVQYVDSLKKQIRESDKLIPVNLVMDEFPSIGTIPDFDKKSATVRSRKINIIIIFQNYGQLMDKYEKNQWETIVANCDTNIYLGGNDSEKTAEYYSKRLGEMTVITKGKRTQEKLLSMTDNKFHPSYMTSESESSRPVMTKDELLRLDKNHAIVLMGSCRPLDVLKFVYTEHPMAKRIVERNQTIHIPNWRREMEGYPDLTDNELESTVEMMTDTGKMREYLELHSNNKTYCLMDYLYEMFPDEYERLKTLLEEKEGTPFTVSQEELEQSFTENADNSIYDEAENNSGEKQPERTSSDSPDFSTSEASFLGNIPPLAKSRGQKSNASEALETNPAAPAASNARNFTARTASATTAEKPDGPSPENAESITGVKTLNLSNIVKSKNLKSETTNQTAKPEIDPNDFLAGMYSKITDLPNVEESVPKTEQKTNQRVKTFGGRAETENKRVKSFGTMKRAENTESRFKKTSKDKINKEEQQNKKELERLQEQDVKITQEDAPVSTMDNQDETVICVPEKVNEEAIKKMESSAKQILPEIDTQGEAKQDVSMDSLHIQKDIQELEIAPTPTDVSTTACSDTEAPIMTGERLKEENRRTDNRECISREPKQLITDKSELETPKEVSEWSSSGNAEKEPEDIADFEDFNPDINKVVLPKATGEEPAEEMDDIIIDTVMDTLPEDTFQDSAFLEDVPPEEVFTGETEENASERIQGPEEDHKEQQSQELEFPAFTEIENLDDTEPDGTETENLDDRETELLNEKRLTESEHQPEDTSSSLASLDTPAVTPNTATVDGLQEMELDIPVDKELNQDDFSLFSDTEESRAVVSGEESTATKRTADKKKKGIRKMSRDKLNF